MRTGDVRVGDSGTGSFTQSGGTNTVSGTLYLGYSPGSSGSYILGGGSLSLPGGPTVYVGCGGTGTFTQSGGTAAGPFALSIGGSGTYNLSAGSLSALFQYVGVGRLGTGTFTQTGGTNALFCLVLAEVPNVGGSYNLSAGSLSAGSQLVGDHGMGIFTQSGGINTVSGNLWLGYYSGSSGTYNLNDGVLVASAISGGSGAAAFNFSGGTLQAAGPLSTALPFSLATSGGNGTMDTAGQIVNLFGQLSGPGGLVSRRRRPIPRGNQHLFGRNDG